MKWHSTSLPKRRMTSLPKHRRGSFACTGAAALGVCWVVLCVLVRGAAQVKSSVSSWVGRASFSGRCVSRVCAPRARAHHARMRVGGVCACVGKGRRTGCGSQGHVTRAVSDAPSDYGGIEHCRRVCGSTGADPNRAVPTNALQRGPLVWSRGRALHRRRHGLAEDAGSRRVSAVVREQPSGLQLAGELESHAQNVETCQSLETSRNGALSALRARGPGRHCRGFARRIN